MATRTPRAEPKGGLHIQHWMSGLITNRAPTATPFRYSFGSPIKYYDALIDGLNVEITPANTLARRPGWPAINSANTFSGTSLAFTSAIIAGTLYDLLDTTTNIYTFNPSTSVFTSLYTKSVTAQTYFAQVGDWLYMSDGTVNQKTDGVNVTKAGVATPTAAPTVSNLNWYDAANQYAHAWAASYAYANTTASAKQYYLLDPTGCLQWAVVPAGTTLKSQSSAPNWAANYNTLGAITQDGTMQWVNCGLVSSWVKSTVYANNTFVANNVQTASEAPAGVTIATSGSTSINWNASNPGAPGITPATGVTGLTNYLQYTALGLAIPTGATVNGIVVTLLRGSNRTGAVQDDTVQLLKAGVAAGNNKALGGSWPQTMWNQYIIPTTGGVRTTYGSPTDLWGTTWTPAQINAATFGFQVRANVSSTRTTTAGIQIPTSVNGVDNPAYVQVYYTVAASDITGTFFGQVVKDSNGNLQICTTGGTSGGSAPTWNKTIGGTTTDNTVTWTCIGTATQLSSLFSWTYAYSFHTSSPHTSTMSPLLQLFAPILGTHVPVQGYGSSDTQVDRNDLYRSTDGGALLLFDASTGNVNAATQWTINDVALDTDLNNQIIGPVAHLNDPPLAGNTVTVQHLGRLWAINGKNLYFSAGPDAVNGDGMQAWPPANVFALPSAGTALISMPQGLVVFTASDMFAVLGGPQLQTFWLQPVRKNFGVQNQNCIVGDGERFFVYTSAQQMFAMSADSRDEIGHPVADKLAANFSAATSYLALHRQGQDQGLFISDGSANSMRYNLNTQSWDPIATPVGGLGPVASIATAAGTNTLLSTVSSYIIKRSTTVFADSGTAYSAFATIGSIVLSEPGELGLSVQSFLLTSAAVGTALTVSALSNEISGTFASIPLQTSDPWQLPASTTINMKRYDWRGNQTALAALVKHLQIKITLPATDTVKNEIFTLSIIPNGD